MSKREYEYIECNEEDLPKIFGEENLREVSPEYFHTIIEPSLPPFPTVESRYGNGSTHQEQSTIYDDEESDDEEFDEDDLEYEFEDEEEDGQPVYTPVDPMNPSHHNLRPLLRFEDEVEEDMRGQVEIVDPRVLAHHHMQYAPLAQKPEPYVPSQHSPLLRAHQKNEMRHLRQQREQRQQTKGDERSQQERVQAERMKQQYQFQAEHFMRMQRSGRRTRVQPRTQPHVEQNNSRLDQLQNIRDALYDTLQKLKAKSVYEDVETRERERSKVNECIESRRIKVDDRIKSRGQDHLLPEVRAMTDPVLKESLNDLLTAFSSAQSRVPRSRNVDPESVEDAKQLVLPIPSLSQMLTRGSDHVEQTSHSRKKVFDINLFDSVRAEKEFDNKKLQRTVDDILSSYDTIKPFQKKRFVDDVRSKLSDIEEQSDFLCHRSKLQKYRPNINAQRASSSKSRYGYRSDSYTDCILDHVEQSSALSRLTLFDPFPKTKLSSNSYKSSTEPRRYRKKKRDIFGFGSVISTEDVLSSMNSVSGGYRPSAIDRLCKPFTGTLASAGGHSEQCGTTNVTLPKTVTDLISRSEKSQNINKNKQVNEKSGKWYEEMKEQLKRVDAQLRELNLHKAKDSERFEGMKQDLSESIKNSICEKLSIVTKKSNDEANQLNQNLAKDVNTCASIVQKQNLKSVREDLMKVRENLEEMKMDSQGNECKCKACGKCKECGM